MARDAGGGARDPNGARVVVPAALWRDKILRDYPELASHLPDVLRAIAEPDRVLPDAVSMNKSQRELSLRSATGRTRGHGASEHQDRPCHL